MADSKTVWIDGPAGKLEGAHREAERPRAAIVIAHPHPLYGGTLHNPVIFHVDRELNRAGMATLRFNFRGVQGSDGFHDEGRGEVRDVSAAVEWMRDRYPSTPLLLVGYSFGSRCCASYALDDRAVAGMVAIGLPVRIWPFGDLSGLGRPFAVVQGTKDEFGSIEEIEPVLARMEPPGRLLTVEGAGHLFPGRAAEAAARSLEAVEGMVASM